MTWLLNYRLTTRIVAALLILLALNLATGAVALAGLWRVDAASGHRTIVMTAMVLSLLTTGLIGWLMQRSITRPVELVVEAVNRIAGGDLSSKIESTGRDEIAWLRHELNMMRKKLKSTMESVRTSADTVATAAREIASGNNDLSERTASQAANLQQTASSMEELSATVKANAENAARANRLAADAGVVAVRSSEVMQQVVATMDAINDSARKIADINAVIDGIAFQTNILALNAAVEAARAGEQGRGFAVVAGEVRNLAQRSATAAREIKTLISASVERAASGATLVGSAGSTMQELLAGVQQVADLISEITRAGEQQTLGISSVKEAIDVMDGMTQQNSSLVEQAAAASQSLDAESQRLAQSVAAFRLVAA